MASVASCVSLADGRRLLAVAVGNDFIAEKPILLHAFAIDRENLPGFGWQAILRFLLISA